MITNMKRVVVDSRRIIAASCEISSVKLLLINIFLPCDTNDSISSDAFLHEISLCETILDNYHDHEVILGGDFNVDFNRNFNNTTLLSDFCKRCNLVSADFHTDRSIDFTFNFNNERFSIIDHFIVSESLFKFSIDSVCVIHEVDNLSDHEPLFGLFKFSNELVSLSTARHYSKRFSWYKATKQNICDYQICVSSELSKINLPIEALSCCNINCNNVNHNNALSKYCEDIYKCCYNAGVAAIPTSDQSEIHNGVKVAGWNEHIRPYREKSLFWHRLWIEADKPRHGALADIMRSTRSKYRYKIRELRRNEDHIRKQAFAENILENKYRDFWKEVNKVRHRHSKFPSTVDSYSNSNDISQKFAANYTDLYNSVPCDSTELKDISDRIAVLIDNDVLSCEHVVYFNEVRIAIDHLKLHKQEGICGLSSDFFINAPQVMYVNISMLITAMLVHGHSPSMLTKSTIIPIIKGSNVGKNDSANYRAISLSSTLCKIIDLIVINRYSDCLITSPNQFSFKPKGSTAVCTSLVKETISYYRVQCIDVYSVFLDASKAFDRVKYSKLFQCLLDRKLPAVFIRLLLSL